MKSKKTNSVKKFIKYSLILLIISLSTSCTSDDNDDKFKNLSLAKAKWNSKGIKNYTINERISCYCGGLLEWEVVVENNIKKEVNFDETKLSNGQTYAYILEKAQTIEDVFNFIENYNSNDAAKFVVEYDAIYGYPKSIYIDGSYEIADDEIGYTYDNFTPLN